VIRKTCVELDIEIIDMAINPDHVHIFMKYPPKYSGISPTLSGYHSQTIGFFVPFVKKKISPQNTSGP